MPTSPSTPSQQTSSKPTTYYSSNPSFVGSKPNSITVYISKSGQTTGATSQKNVSVPKGFNVQSRYYLQGKSGQTSSGGELLAGAIKNELIPAQQVAVAPSQVQAPIQPTAKEQLMSKAGIRDTASDIFVKQAAAGATGVPKKDYLSSFITDVSSKTLGGITYQKQQEDINKQLTEFKSLTPEQAMANLQEGKAGYAGVSTKEGTKILFTPSSSITEQQVLSGLSTRERLSALGYSGYLAGVRTAEGFLIELPANFVYNFGANQIKTGEKFNAFQFKTIPQFNQGYFAQLKSAPSDTIQKTYQGTAIAGGLIAGGLGIKNVYFEGLAAGMTRTQAIGTAIGETISSLSPLNFPQRVFISSENIGDKRFIQIQKGSVIKNIVGGKAGEYQLSTMEGKTYQTSFGTPEGALYAAVPKYEYAIYTPNIFNPTLETGVISAPRFSFVSTAFNQNLFGTKQVGENTFLVRGKGTREVLNIGQNIVQTGRYSLGTQLYATREVQPFQAIGYANTALGKASLNIGEAKFFQPTERVTYVEGGTVTRTGSAYGESLVGRARVSRGAGFYYKTGSISSGDQTLEFGKTGGIYTISGQKIPLVFSTVTRTSGAGGFDITSSSGELSTGLQSSLKNLQSVTQVPSKLQVQSPKVAIATTTSVIPTLVSSSKSTTQTQASKVFSKTVQTQAFTQTQTTSQVFAPAQIQMGYFTQAYRGGQIQVPSITQTQVQTQTQAPPFVSPPFSPPPLITGTGFTPFPSTFLFPPILPFKFQFDFGGIGRIRTKKQRKKYTPDYPSLVFGRKGKQPKGMETGLRIRPIPKGFTFAFGRIKL